MFTVPNYPIQWFHTIFGYCICNLKSDLNCMKIVPFPFFFKISIRNEQRFLNESNPIWNWLVYKFTLYCNTFWIKLMTFPIGISIERHLYWNISVYVCALWNVLLTRRRRFIIQFCSQLNFLFGFLFGNRKILLLWNAHSFFDNCIQFLLLFLLLLLMLQKYT